MYDKYLHYIENFVYFILYNLKKLDKYDIYYISIHLILITVFFKYYFFFFQSINKRKRILDKRTYSKKFASAILQSLTCAYSPHFTINVFKT